MPTTFAGAKRWFRPDGEVEFHVCTDADPAAPCGRRLRYNVDSVRDYEPEREPVCAHCHAVANGLPVPGAAESKPAAQKQTTKPRTTKPRGTKKSATKK